MDGRMDKVKGRIKQVIGNLTNNRHLIVQGKADEMRGIVRNRINRVSERLKRPL